MKTRKMTLGAMLVSIGVVLGNILYIPVGMSKCFFVQHSINLIAGISFGPAYAVAIAFLISLIRNILGTGSLLAFPGSMIGALLVGLVYKRTKNKYLAGLGEVFGTGILGGLVSFPLAKIFMGKEVLALFFVYPFILSSIGGNLIGLVLMKLIDFERLLEKLKIN